jgi:heterodisulfide reductase subunit A
VGAVIVTTGFQHLTPAARLSTTTIVVSDVITLTDLEKMLNHHVVRPPNGDAPKIAFIQCVGSRDRQIGNGIEVCCGIASKQAMGCASNC